MVGALVLIATIGAFAIKDPGVVATDGGGGTADESDRGQLDTGGFRRATATLENVSSGPLELVMLEGYFEAIPGSVYEIAIQVVDYDVRSASVSVSSWNVVAGDRAAAYAIGTSEGACTTYGVCNEDALPLAQASPEDPLIVPLYFNSAALPFGTTVVEATVSSSTAGSNLLTTQTVRVRIDLEPTAAPPNSVVDTTIPA